MALLPVTALFGDIAAGGYNPLLSLYLLTIACLYFTWPWTHGGQTLGMRSWKVCLVAADGGPVAWRQAALRFFVALLSLAALGLGYFWALRDRDGLTWHDRAAATRLERVE